ncbi:MAG: response regulator transcription factor [Methylococcaceae bacterium]|nr:response regulator transcription factor [Methylococcaceae bacterium]
MAQGKRTVFIVDDDEAVRDSLGFLMKTIGLVHESYALALDFLAEFNPNRSGCLLLDIRMPGMSGLELQKELARRHSILPIIFITGHGDVPMAVEAMREGAFDFIQKPFRDQDLIDCVHNALELDDRNRAVLIQREQVSRNLNSLTDRERQILERVVDGKSNKTIAAELYLSQRTIEVHRAHVMEKMQADSVAHLVRMIVNINQDGNS